ncbi:MAG: J domain-containing protein [Myxococcota bacterium]|jgi:DnaJ-class molecular chaperone|nr:J domain-containing protein [Myxococcota bacterium]
MPAQSLDPYAALGVSRDADERAIKRAYRELAQRHHPDRNPDDPVAEERFKEVSAAYAVLSDPERRKNYDEFGAIALDPNFDAARARAAGSNPFGGGHGFAGRGFAGGGASGGFSSLFDEFFRDSGGGFSRRDAPRPAKGRDREITLELELEEASEGCERRVSTAGNSAVSSSTLRVRIPPGTADKARIRLAGKGGPGQHGGPPGDLYCRVRQRKHRIFEVDGHDLLLSVPIRVGEAMLGAQIEVPTLDSRVTLTIPPGTNGGSKLRVRGKGMARPGGKPPGDLYVTLTIQVPKTDSEETRALAEALDALDPDDLRSHLFR